MKSKLLFLGASVSAMLLAGCGTQTKIYDPATTTLNIRQDGHVSSEEMRQIAADAAKGALSNAKFKTFLKKYRAEMKDEDAIPVLKLDWALNYTDDPDLNTDEITDLLNTELLNSGIVDVSMAEGAGKSESIADSRNLKNDANFDQTTVAKKGTLQAARVVLRPKVMSNTTVDDDGKRAVVRTFVLEMADIKTGLLMWKYTKQLGYTKSKGLFGW